MPLYFAYGANMTPARWRAAARARRPLGLARLERHRLAVMREGWLTAVRDPSSAVHGVLWDLALSDVAALDRYEGMAQGLYVKLTQPVVAGRGPRRAIVYCRRQRRAGSGAARLHGRRSRRGALLAAAARGDRGAGGGGEALGQDAFGWESRGARKRSVECQFLAPCGRFQWLRRQNLSIATMSSTRRRNSAASDQ